MISIEPWSGLILREKDIQQDSGRGYQWWRAGHHCRSAALGSKEAGDKLLTRKTPEAERSQPYDLRQWVHHGLHPLDDEGAGAMLQIR